MMVILGHLCILSTYLLVLSVTRACDNVSQNFVEASFHYLWFVFLLII